MQGHRDFLRKKGSWGNNLTNLPASPITRQITRISDARAIVAHMAVEETGHKATDVARHLGIKQTSVLQSVKKGKVLCNSVGLQA